MNKLTIITYHYVRKFKGSKFPKIKGRDVTEFRNQMKYIEKNFNIVSAPLVIESLKNNDVLPKNPCWLTFDDGFIDHFENVLPVFDEFGFKGSFFPSAKPIIENKILDVHKIHFILASIDDSKVLAEDLEKIINGLDQRQKAIKSFDYYWEKYGKVNTYDDLYTSFVKIMLNTVLPDKERSDVCDMFFKKYVSEDTKGFAEELYMSKSQLKELLNQGMHIGGHGYKHLRLDTIENKQQEIEIFETINLLKTLGSDLKNWVMCYPYGSWNDKTLSILRKSKCAIGLTVEKGVSDISKEDPLLLKRLDTNELPN
jgi:peptidoglycan/xylan/chitin deacetylase (PgdA/CDA1 family)